MNDGRFARWLRLWFAIDGRIDRGTYLRHGSALVLVKYAGDVAIVRATERRWFSPVEYLVPEWSTPDALAPYEAFLAWPMLVWALPFLWIMFTMSMRRARDAGISPWEALWCLVPVVKFAMMLVLACLRTAEPRSPAGRRAIKPLSPEIPGALLGLLITVPPGLLTIWFLTEHLGTYANSLFVAVPFAIGTASAYITVRRGGQLSDGLVAAVIAGLMLTAGLIAIGLEGFMCVVMAFPVWLVPTSMGALLGASLAKMLPQRSALAGVPLLVVPLTFAGDATLPPPPLREVVTSIEIDAPPETVWRHVIQFAEIPPPTEWWFSTGIAYPVRARIDGEGVGAVRHCEFTTGPFVEPITAWEPPHRLAFDVTAQPAPMQEWSFYAQVHPPHLDGYFRSRCGEFRLVALPGNRTRLEGSTWYTLDLEPLPYWQLWADWIIHRIHERVLHWIRVCAERNR